MYNIGAATDAAPLILKNDRYDRSMIDSHRFRPMLFYLEIKKQHLIGITQIFQNFVPGPYAIYENIFNL